MLVDVLDTNPELEPRIHYNIHSSQLSSIENKHPHLSIQVMGRINTVSLKQTKENNKKKSL